MKDRDGLEDSERRDYPRIRKLRLISYVSRSKRQKSSTVRIGRTIDISPSGARVETHQPIIVGAGIEINIAVGDATANIQGKVLRVTEVEDKVYVAAIKFDKTQKQFLNFAGKRESWDFRSMP